MQLSFFRKERRSTDFDKREWGTPQSLYYELYLEFKFTVDVCASSVNAKCVRYWDEETDGLVQDWSKDVCWMNPPYGRELGQWMYKAYTESQRGATVVCLVPVCSDLGWWHDYAMKGEIRFLRGRVSYIAGDKKAGAAPFPSAIVIFRPKEKT